MTSSQVILGRIVAPFGIQGWLKLQTCGDDPLSWRSLKAFAIGQDESSVLSWPNYALKGLRLQGKGVVFALDGVIDRTAAEFFVGRLVAVARDQLPVLPEGEYYWGDLVGMSVLSLSGERLGVVRGLLETGAHSVLDVDAGGRSCLIPFVDAHVRRVSLEDRLICVDWSLDWL